MADQKISAMPSAATLDGTELVPMVQSGANVKATLAALGATQTNRIALLDSTTQSVSSAGTPTAVTFDTTAFSQNISVVSGSRITFAVAGDYVLDFSFQMANVNSQIQTANFWVRLNGSDYPLSNTNLDIPQSHGGNDGQIVAAWSIPGSASAGDYVELFWTSTSTDVTIKYLPASVSPAHPATPSAIATVFQIG